MNDESESDLMARLALHDEIWNVAHAATSSLGWQDVTKIGDALFQLGYRKTVNDK